MALPADDFPALPRYEKVHFLKVDPKRLLEMIDLLSRSMAVLVAIVALELELAVEITDVLSTPSLQSIVAPIVPARHRQERAVRVCARRRAFRHRSRFRTRPQRGSTRGAPAHPPFPEAQDGFSAYPGPSSMSTPGVPGADHLRATES